MSTDPVELAVAAARKSQPLWASTPLGRRLELLSLLRRKVGSDTREICAQLSALRPTPELLMGELVPWLDACSFLENKAASILATRHLGAWSRPWWLSGVRSEVQRSPHGVVLVIAPCNYPWLLPAVQVIQAVAAGNAVLWKPGAGGTPVARLFQKLALECGFPPGVINVLPETKSAAEKAIALGVDKVFLTGSTETGRAVLDQLAGQTIPASVELSGCDAMWVREDADLELASRALLFSLNWNNSATCMAARRIFVHREVSAGFKTEFLSQLSTCPQKVWTCETAARYRESIMAALNEGARVIHGSISSDGEISGPLVLDGVKPGCRIAREDIFAPVVSLIEAGSDEEVLTWQRDCPYALTASIFTRNGSEAQRLASLWTAGVVIINDLIATTADPRVPFGGRKASGFGVTRGAEGLLEMTVPKVVQVNRSAWRPHYNPPTPHDIELFHAMAGARHGSGLLQRLGFFWEAMRHGLKATPPWSVTRPGSMHSSNNPGTGKDPSRNSTTAGTPGEIQAPAGKLRQSPQT